MKALSKVLDSDWLLLKLKLCKPAVIKVCPPPLKLVCLTNRSQVPASLSNRFHIL